MKSSDCENPAIEFQEESGTGVCLVIETSTPHATLATISPDGAIDQRGFQSDRNHNAMLFGPLQELLGAPTARLGIGRVLVGSGPGSYSGTRVGIAAAQGVAIAVGCPAIAVPSILAVPSAAAGGACLAIGDARRGSYWSAAIDGLRLASEPALCDAATLQNRVAGALSAGSAVFTFEESRSFLLPGELLSQIKLEFPDAIGLWRAWSASAPETRRRWASEVPQPIYLKPPHITPAKQRNPPVFRGQQG